MPATLLQFKPRFTLKLRGKEKELAKLQEVEISRGELYECKLNHKSFRGPCPIVACHANIKEIHPSRCTYLFYKEKDEFDKLDLMYALNLSEKKIREITNRGRFKVHCTAILFNILTRVRDNNKIEHSCPHCGVLRTTYGKCFNKIECQKRFDFSKDFIDNSYLSIPDLRITNKDLFLLLYNVKKIKEFIDQLEENNNKPNLHEVFGTTPELMSKATEMRSLIGE